MTAKPPRPPRHLRAPTRKWWAETVAGYEFEAHHRLELTMAGELWDRKVEAREVVKKEGAYYVDRFGAPHAHPAVAVERDCTLGFLRIVRELRLDSTEGPESRPPGLGER